MLTKLPGRLASTVPSHSRCLRRARAAIALPVLAVLLSGVPAAAHHGGAVEWQDQVRGPVTGTATRFSFTFPHVVVYIDVEGPDGIESWAMTTRWTPTILRKQGWRRDSIVPGDTVTVTYAPHATDPRVAQMRTILVNGEAFSLEPL